MLQSSIAWIDFSEQDRRKMMEVVALASDGVTILARDGAGNVYCLRYVEGSS